MTRKQRAGKSEDDDEAPVMSRRRQPKRKSRETWDSKIRQLLDTQSREELIEFVWSLVQRFPALQEEFRERIALSEGDVDRLVAEARRELHKVASEPGWRNHWDNEGYTPDYSRLKHRLERLVDQGHYDAVAKLGREVIRCSLRRVSESHDHGETGMAVADCLPVVFQAVCQSTLTGPEKIMFAIDAHLEDDYDMIDDKTDDSLDAEWSAGDWSAVADQLADRLRHESAGSSGEFSRNYRRDQVSNWMTQALQNAGRQEEVLAVYQHEARTTGSYERLVRFLVESKKLDEAERWAREGLEHTREKLPGIASSLARLLCELAHQRRAWDVVAAHAAWPFFANPNAASFDELVKAARKAKCEEQVRSTALKFLETGNTPGCQSGERVSCARRSTCRSCVE